MKKDHKHETASNGSRSERRASLKSTPGPCFYVFVMAYASQAIKERIERGEHASQGEITANLVHMSTSE